MAKKKKKAKKQIPVKKQSSAAAKKDGFVQKTFRSIHDYWAQKSPVLKFLIGFAACMILFYIIYLSPFFIDYIGRPILTVQAKISSFLLNILGQNTTATEDLISSSEYTISIK